MSRAMMQELIEHPEFIHRWMVEDYHRMIADGTLAEGEPYELLDGQIVRKIRSDSEEDPMTVGVEHALVVKRCGKLSRLLEPWGCHMQTQQPITLPPYNEPEPDGAVVRGTEEDYAGRHPGAADVLCVIEVADTSLKRDRGYKLQVYADSGIPMYILLNLVNRVAEVYTEPVKGQGRYAQIKTVPLHENIEIPTTKGQPIVVPLKQLVA